jgi:hypothetical protein
MRRFSSPSTTCLVGASVHRPGSLHAHECALRSNAVRPSCALLAANRELGGVLRSVLAICRPLHFCGHHHVHRPHHCRRGAIHRRFCQNVSRLACASQDRFGGTTVEPCEWRQAFDDPTRDSASEECSPLASPCPPLWTSLFCQPLYILSAFVHFAIASRYTQISVLQMPGDDCRRRGG